MGWLSVRIRLAKIRRQRAELQPGAFSTSSSRSSRIHCHSPSAHATDENNRDTHSLVNKRLDLLSSNAARIKPTFRLCTKIIVFSQNISALSIVRLTAGFQRKIQKTKKRADSECTTMYARLARLTTVCTRSCPSSQAGATPRL